MSNETKHAVSTQALNALFEALRSSSDLPAKEVTRLIQAVAEGAVQVTLPEPTPAASVPLEEAKAAIDGSTVSTDQASS